jgi:hypothetical protein
MIKKFHAITSIFLLVGGMNAADLTQEVKLTIDGKDIVAQDGATVEVAGKKVLVSIAKTQVFTGDGYRFRLQNSFPLEVDDAEDEYKEYTFDGKNVIFSVSEIKDDTTTEEYIDRQISILSIAVKAKALKKGEAQEIVLNGKSIPGKCVIARILGINQYHYYYPIAEGRVRLVFSLERSDDQEDIDEYDLLIKTLKESFSFMPAKDSPP